MMPLIRATPFHSRTSAINRLNAWTNRNGWTLPARFADAHAEALAARTTAVITDISWRWRVAIDGARAEEFLARLLTRSPVKLEQGSAFKALWLTDFGAVRGACAVARFGPQSFQLIATESDLGWIEQGAALFDVKVEECGEQEGGLAIIGPCARKIMERAGLDAELEPLHFRKLFWRDLDVTLSRLGEHGGYEIWCKADDASLVWNRIVKAGEPFACIPAGAEAMDILDLEAGVLRPGRDYEAARDGFAAQPTPSDLGLLSLIDDEHTLFNGRSALLAAKGTKTRVGVQMDGDAPAPRTPLLRNGHRVGETMNARYSPALQCAIALAVIDKTDAVVDMRLALPDGSAATVVDLPFLPVPDPIAE